MRLRSRPLLLGGRNHTFLLSLGCLGSSHESYALRIYPHVVSGAAGPVKEPRLILILGDQLSPNIAALQKGNKDRDVVVMAEVMAEATYVPHHPKKIALVLSAMRKYAEWLRQEGWTVAYTQLDDPRNSGSITGELLHHATNFGATKVIATEPGEWRLNTELTDFPLPLTMLPDSRFITSTSDFANWAKDRKELRMEWFYRDVRRKTGLLMEGDKPAGGKWNFDSDNRKVAPIDVRPVPPPAFAPDKHVSAVLDLVEARFAANFGDLRPFSYATDRDQALQVLDHFITHNLPHFGDYQDVMIRGEPTLWHSVISPYLNIGLLSPLEVCARAVSAWTLGAAPLNAVEGFIRQIIGWREYVRGIYFLKGPDYVSSNALGHSRKLPDVYWGGETGMQCMKEAVAQARSHAYAHHIQRLMVTGNFALLAGIDPQQVHEWYLSVYIDAFEWVEAPNTIGMSQYADGGVLASKPYVSSGAYIARMSDYCAGCVYDVRAKSGRMACPFNVLYWHFIDRHADQFRSNPRMAVICRSWENRNASDRAQIMADAEELLIRLDQGEPL
jgi:deoxyribodipyrimidine photolyase-related protein